MYIHVRSCTSLASRTLVTYNYCYHVAHISFHQECNLYFYTHGDSTHVKCSIPRPHSTPPIHLHMYMYIHVHVYIPVRSQLLKDNKNAGSYIQGTYTVCTRVLVVFTLRYILGEKVRKISRNFGKNKTCTVCTYMYMYKYVHVVVLQ